MPWSAAPPASAQGEDPISDLPFVDFGSNPEMGPGNGDGRYITCGWHLNCLTGSAGNGVDFRARPAGQVPIVAAGNGNISYSSRAREGDDSLYGERIDINHDGATSRYAHLARRFFSAGTHVCRYVFIGIAGDTTTPGHSMAPHLHFESQPNKFGPIFGDRSAGTSYGNGTFNSSGTTVHHTCGTGGCAEDTNAYTVDDSQRSNRCRTCADEFVESEESGTPHNHEWTREPNGGIGYSVKDQGSYFWTEMQEDDPRQKVVWSPRLHATDSSWDIYAYIPEFDNHRDDVSPQAYYDIETCSSGGSCSSFATVIEDPSAAAAKFLKLNSSPVSTSWNNPNSGHSPIRVTLTNKRNTSIGKCQGDACDGKVVLADAMLFIPSDCD